MHRFGSAVALVATALALAIVSIAGASTPGGDVRLTNDNCVATTAAELAACRAEGGGYVSSYTLAGLGFYTDAVLDECSVARGRQNEPSVAVDPRTAALPDSQKVLVGSSNDYCGVYVGRTSTGLPSPTGPIWLGYYRSENGGGSFVSSLVPGYPGDTSPFALTLPSARTASSGDPVIAWDAQGRVFLGSESSDDPAGSPKSFGDVFVARYENPLGPTGLTADDGKRYTGTTIVSRGSSAPSLLGVFNDKTAIEADHNSDGKCDNDVYFAYSRFTGQAQTNAIYFSRSTDHGVTFSQAMKLSASIHGVQFPDIAVTGSSNVYVTYRQFASQSGQPDAIVYQKSTDCGATFSRPRTVQTFVPYDAQDVRDPEPIPIPASSRDDRLGEEEAIKEAGRARDCGDFSNHCESDYTFFRRDTQVRSAGDQYAGADDDSVYIVYDPTKPGTETPTGTTYGSVDSGTGSQGAVYSIRLNGMTGVKEVPPTPVDLQPADREEPGTGGHQTFPDISADSPRTETVTGTILHAIWWDSRLDPCYSRTRPIGNCAGGSTVPSLDSWAAYSTTGGERWTGSTRVSGRSSNPNYEQFANRTVPFAGDYLWVTSLGSYSFGVWTDWRDTRQGLDPREIEEDEDDATADVYQCRTFDAVTGAWSGDTCPHDGGIDQNIYGDKTP